jgi:hypothetical protein
VPAAEIAIHSNLKATISSPWGFPLREDVPFTDIQGALASVLAAVRNMRPPAMPGAPSGKWAFGFSAFVLTASLLADIWVSIRVAQKAVRNFIPLG